MKPPPDEGIEISPRRGAGAQHAIGGDVKKKKQSRALYERKGDGGMSSWEKEKGKGMYSSPGTGPGSNLHYLGGQEENSTDPATGWGA